MARTLVCLLSTAALLALAEASPTTDAISLDKRGDDCDKWAKNFYADVDCHYTWTTGSDFLDYTIFIQPTGQSNADMGWCHGINANIRGHCGSYVDFQCEDYLSHKLHNPVTNEVEDKSGIKMKFHWNGSFQEPEVL